MTEERKKEATKEEIARAAEKRRRDLENPEQEGKADPVSGAFNPVEGVPPHGASIPGRKR